MKNSTNDQKNLDAVRTLIKFIGDDPNREGLKDTPKRVLKALKENFSGYAEIDNNYLTSVFNETQNYDNFIILKNISFSSHCEHHMMPMNGTINLAYHPMKAVVGLSKLVRLCKQYSKRLQSQERLTNEIGQEIKSSLKAKFCIVIIKANHSCMTDRGVHQRSNQTITHYFCKDLQLLKDKKNAILKRLV